MEPPTADLVAAATFEAMKARADELEAMKARADELAPNTEAGFWRSNDAFFDRARSGDWRSILADDVSRRRYEKAVASLAPQDLAAWLHAGWLGAVSG